MENASKALIIAGGVLIGILILSLAVFLFADFSVTSSKVHDQVAQNQLTKFNAQFTIYEGREDITIYNIITVANLAKENNSYDEYNKIYVALSNMGADNNQNLQDSSLNKYQQLIDTYNKVKPDGTLEKKFKCSSIEYRENGRVKKITFNGI